MHILSIITLHFNIRLFCSTKSMAQGQEAGGLRPNAIAPAYTKLACGIPVVGLQTSCGGQP